MNQLINQLLYTAHSQSSLLVLHGDIAGRQRRPCNVACSGFVIYLFGMGAVYFVPLLVYDRFGIPIFFPIPTCPRLLAITIPLVACGSGIIPLVLKRAKFLVFLLTTHVHVVRHQFGTSWDFKLSLRGSRR